MLYIVKKIKCIIKNAFTDLSLRCFLFTIDINRVKLTLLRKFVTSIFYRLLFLLNKKQINSRIDDIVFFLDKLVINVRVVFNLLIGMMQNDLVVHQQEIIDCSNQQYNSRQLCNITNFSPEFHMNSKCYPTVFPFPMGYRIPYRNIMDQQQFLHDLHFNYRFPLNAFNTIQGSSFSSLFSDIPIHTSHTLMNHLNPINYNFFLDKRLPLCFDSQYNPVFPGYVMKNPIDSTVFRYIPDHMMYYLYSNGNGTGFNPFEAARHLAHQGLYGFQFSPVYRVYRVIAFEQNHNFGVDDMGFVKFTHPSQPTGFLRVPKVVSTSAHLANWNVVYDKNQMYSMNEVFIFPGSNPNHCIIISDRYLNGKIIECLGDVNERSSNFLNNTNSINSINSINANILYKSLHNKKLELIDLTQADANLLRGRLFGQNIHRINIVRHFDIEKSVLVVKYRT